MSCAGRAVAAADGDAADADAKVLCSGRHAVLPVLPLAVVAGIWRSNLHNDVRSAGDCMHSAEHHGRGLTLALMGQGKSRLGSVIG
jgi:hypothetical protein